MSLSSKKICIDKKVFLYSLFFVFIIIFVLFFASLTKKPLSVKTKAAENNIPTSIISSTKIIKSLVVSVNFIESNFIFNKDNLNTTFFDTKKASSVTNLLSKQSYGKTGLTGTVYPTTIKSSISYENFCNPDSAQSKKEFKKLYDLFKNESLSNDVMIYIFPDFSSDLCSNASNNGGFKTKNNIIIKNTLEFYSTVQHEFGHFFLDKIFITGHSDALTCAKTGKQIDRLQNCQFINFLDLYDSMGNGSGHYNIMLKNKIGWILNEKILTVDKSGTYYINSIGSISPIYPLGIKVKKGPVIYYLEYRTISDVFNMAPLTDYFLRQIPKKPGVQVRISHGDGYALIDTHIETPGDLFDSPMYENESFFDSNNKISVQVLRADENKAKLQINFNAQSAPTPLSEICTSYPNSSICNSKCSIENPGFTCKNGTDCCKKAVN